MAASAVLPRTRTTGRASRATTSTTPVAASATGASCRDRRTWAAAEGRARADSPTPSPSSPLVCCPRRPWRRAPDCTRKEIGAAANAGPCDSSAAIVRKGFASLAQRSTLPAAVSAAADAGARTQLHFEPPALLKDTASRGIAKMSRPSTLPMSDTVRSTSRWSRLLDAGWLAVLLTLPTHPRCSNVNWAKRKMCNTCNANKPVRETVMLCDYAATRLRGISAT